MRWDKYLEKLGYDHKPPANFETLVALHERHSWFIPFENIDAYTNRENPLTTEAVFNKIVEQPRGDYCYPLNSLFFQLLVELGFTTLLWDAKMYDDDGKLLEDSSHMLIGVDILDQFYLADVGWGGTDSPLIALNSATIKKEGNDYVRYSKDKPLYRFTRKAGLTVDHFLPRHQYHCSNEQSIFQRILLVTRMSSTMASTLRNCQFTHYEFCKKVVAYKVFVASQLDRTLKHYFNIRLQQDQLDQLWSKLSHSQYKCEYQIRAACVDEVDAINQLIIRSRAVWGYSDEQNQEFIKQSGVTPQYVKSQLCDVLEVDHEIIAVMGATLSRQMSVDFLFLDPNYQNQGIGRMLFEHLGKQLQSRGATQFDFITNPYARGFFEKLGASVISDYEDTSPGMKNMCFTF